MIYMARITIYERGEYLSSVVFAIADGIVTTFAIVAGSAGASLSPNIVLILGFANLFADGFSMASGNYLGRKSEIEYEEVRGKNPKYIGTPLIHGILTFASFSLSGLIPLLPFLFSDSNPFMISTFLVILSLLGAGFLKSFYIRENPIKGGVEVFATGGLAAFVAFVTGFLINKYVL